MTNSLSCSFQSLILLPMSKKIFSLCQLKKLFSTWNQIIRQSEPEIIFNVCIGLKNAKEKRKIQRDKGAKTENTREKENAREKKYNEIKKRENKKIQGKNNTTEENEA